MTGPAILSEALPITPDKVSTIREATNTLGSAPSKGVTRGPPLSYDLRLFKARPEEATEAWARLNSVEYSKSTPDPQKEGLQRRIISTLMAGQPRLELVQVPFDQIARYENITVEHARWKYRHQELKSPEGGNGVQIILRDDEAVVAVPFWHRGHKAKEVFQELWVYLQIICRESGYLIYDPQLGRVCDPATGWREVLAHYKETVHEIRNRWPAGEEQLPPVYIRELPACNQGAVLVAARPDGTLCGFAEVCIRLDRVSEPSPVRVAYLKAWYVAPQFRGEGIGRKLLEKAAAWAAKCGLRELASEASPQQQSLLETYVACGFTETCRTVRFTKLIGGDHKSIESGKGSDN